MGSAGWVPGIHKTFDRSTGLQQASTYCNRGSENPTFGHAVKTKWDRCDSIHGLLVYSVPWSKIDMIATTRRFATNRDGYWRKRPNHGYCTQYSIYTCIYMYTGTLLTFLLPRGICHERARIISMVDKFAYILS